MNIAQIAVSHGFQWDEYHWVNPDTGYGVHVNLPTLGGGYYVSKPAGRPPMKRRKHYTLGDAMRAANEAAERE